MLVRLVTVALGTLLAGVVSYTREHEFDTLYTWFVWGTLVTGYLLTIAFSWLLPHVRSLVKLAWAQTLVDVGLATVVVQMTAGIESGFAFLYLLAILGAAVMGDRRQCWITLAICASLFVMFGALHASGWLIPLTPAGPVAPPPERELWITIARTLAGMLGVTALSAYLNTQLASSVYQAGSLRALNENIVRSLTSGLITADRSGRVLYLNPMAREILGISDDPMGTPIDAMLPGVGRLLDDAGTPRFRHEIELRINAGQILNLGLSTAPLVDTDKTHLGWVVNFQDVTQVHQLAQEVRRNERLAAIGGLAASLAHEVRNPLAAISGSAELLSRETPSEENARLLAVIRRESARLDALVSSLLAFTRPQPRLPVDIDLGKAVAEVAEAFQADPANDRVHVVLNCCDDVRANVDPSQLSQILWNLLRNATEAMQQCGCIELTVTRGDNAVAITVHDDGPGIRPEHLDDIFDPFFTTKEHGTGFGLALVHRMVRDHGGSIVVSSEPGRGTAFIMRLPR